MLCVGSPCRESQDLFRETVYSETGWGEKEHLSVLGQLQCVGPPGLQDSGVSLYVTATWCSYRICGENTVLRA